MNDFIKVCQNIKRDIEIAATMVIDNPKVNEYFIELYGMAETEDNTIECIIDYIKERSI